MLSQAQIHRYRQDGYLVIEGFASASACASLRQRAIEIVNAWQPSTERTVFTTDQQERTSNREFLDSGPSIWCFFEADAFDERGELGYDKQLSINKIGHAMHDLDPEFESFSYTPALAAVAEDIGMNDPLAIQSMYIFKQPRIGGEVKCHQDATFLYTDPITVTGFWFAVEDATLENGCLWVQPGGHHGPLRQRFERAGPTSNDGTRFVPLDDTPFSMRAAKRLEPPPSRIGPSSQTDAARAEFSMRAAKRLEPPPSRIGPSSQTDAARAFALDGFVPVEAPSGTLIVVNGLLPHWSDVNRSETSRHAYSLHCIEAAAEYPATNWLQRPNDAPLRSLRCPASSH